MNPFKLYLIRFLLCSAFLLSCILLPGCRPSATAQDTEQDLANSINSQQAPLYAEWVEGWLANEHNLSLGTLLFAIEEEVALDQFYANNIQVETVSVSNRPFSMALQLQTDRAQNLPWDSGISSRITTPIQADDNILLTFWVRALESEADRGALLVTLQKSQSNKAIIGELIPIAADWQQITLLGTAAEASEADEIVLFFGTGAQTQKLEFGGLALLNYENSVPRAALPQIDLHTYTGQAADATWRATADERIDRNRKADLEVIVLDSDNNPIEDASVTIEMQEHAFGFGTAINTNTLTGSSSDAEIYRNKFLDLDGKGHGFNRAVPENDLKWTRWESSDGQYRENAIAAINWLQEHNIKVRGHNLIWPSWSHMPADLKVQQDDVEYLVQRTNNRIVDMLSEPSINAQLYEWDVVNELRTNTDIINALNRDGNTPIGEAIYSDWFELAAESDGNTKLFINDYGMLSDGALLVGQHNHYKYFIQELIDNGDQLDGIGLQSHLDYPLAGPEQLYDLLNDFAKYNKDIVITEYDISLRYRNESDFGEATAGAYTRDFLTTIFSHPSVTGFLMWGYWDEIHWQDDSPMFRKDWSIKPAGEAFIDLVFNQWWTDEEGETNADGRYKTRGFLGEYTITVTVGAATKTVDTHLTSEDGSTIITFDKAEILYSTHIPFVSNKN